MKYYYTQSQYKELLKHLCIVGTSNEQKNQHISEFFKEKEIPFETRALKTGDYCFKITKCEELGRLRKLKMLVLSWQNDSVCTNNNAKISGSICFFVICFRNLRSKLVHFLSILSNNRTKFKLNPKKYTG